MQLTTDGLVIRSINIGEADRIITILTREKGVVRASARGARRLKSKFSTATRLLCYSSYTLYRGRDLYIIDEAQPQEFFLGVNGALEKLALAQYLAELSGSLAPEEENADMYLRILLNALHLIEKGEKPRPLIKAAFELRVLTLSGYMPDLVACRECGVYEADTLYFEPVTGTMICGDCAKEHTADQSVPLQSGALAAMRHAVYADFKRLYAFTLSEEALDQFAHAAECYVLCRMERSFKTLDFYRSIE